MTTNEITKDLLRAKGTRVVLTDEAQARLAKVEPVMVRESYIIKDLMERKNYNKPSHIGIGPDNMGLAWGISFADIAEIMLP